MAVPKIPGAQHMELVITCLDSLGTLVLIKYIELFLEDATRGYRESSYYFK